MTETSRSARDQSRRRFLRYLAASPLAASGFQAALAQANPNAPVNAINQTIGPVNVFDFEALAEQAIPPAHFGYLQTGVLDDKQVRVNREGFDKFGIRVRRLVNPADVDLSVSVFGTDYATPIFFSPIGAAGAFHPEGELAVSRAARSKDTLQMLSTVATRSIEDVIEARGGPAWFQLYTTGSEEVASQITRRAEDAGASAIVLTVDLLGGGHRRETAARYTAMDDRDCFACHDSRLGFAGTVARRPNLSGIDPALAGGLGSTWVNWDYVGRLRDQVQGRLILKGIVTAEDAELALEYGVDGIIISNHGGRAEESLISTIEQVPEIAAVVNGRMPIIVDSGFRRGTDVFKALAMGATAVGIGRPHCWGLGAMGQEGVEQVVDILNAELRTTMRQAGCASIAEITDAYVRRLT